MFLTQFDREHNSFMLTNPVDNAAQAKYRDPRHCKDALAGFLYVFTMHLLNE